MGIATLLLLLASWIFLFYTGHAGRAYEVLRPGAHIVIGQQSLTVAQAAERYQPLLFMVEGTSSPAQLHMWYEAVRADDTLTLVYHPVWENETHPNRVTDLLYGLFRAAYYGYPLFDIEYIQVNVAMADGLVGAMRFETGFGEDYSSPVNEHLVAVVAHRTGGGYLMRISRRSGEFVREEEVRPLFQNGVQPCLGILTWNHLLVLRQEGDKSYTQPVRMRLVYLEEEDYARYKIARRSQGDYATR